MSGLIKLLLHMCRGSPSFSRSGMIGSGCSSLVYAASVGQQPCVVKELYPVGLRERKLLVRNADGRIRLRRWPIGWRLWNRERLRCLRAAAIALALRDHPKIGRYVVHLRSVRFGNGTIYTVTEGLDGRSWDLIADENTEQILQTGSRIALLCWELHRENWMLVDIKASNFLVEEGPEGDRSVRLADFDSMLPLNRAKHQKRFLCSSETAPLELLAGRAHLAGKHSDVYSLAMMLFRKLGGTPGETGIRERFSTQIGPRLSGWTETERKLLLNLFLDALEQDPHRRLDSCRELAARLQEILRQREMPI